jgi:hypothetical protein
LLDITGNIHLPRRVVPDVELIFSITSYALILAYVAISAINEYGTCISDRVIIGTASEEEKHHYEPQAHFFWLIHAVAPQFFGRRETIDSQ